LVGRSVPEWVGKRPESMPGNLVRLRIYARQNGICACGCTKVMNLNRDTIHCDHIVPLIDEGLNVESNLQLMLAKCHAKKTSAEASQRAEARQHQAKAFTRPPSKWPSRGFAKSSGQRKATTPVKGKFPFDITAKRGSNG